MDWGEMQHVKYLTMTTRNKFGTRLLLRRSAPLIEVVVCAVAVAIWNSVPRSARIGMPQPPPPSDFESTVTFIVDDSLQRGSAYAKARSLETWTREALNEIPDVSAILILGIWGAPDTIGFTDGATTLIGERAQHTGILAASSVRYLVRLLEVNGLLDGATEPPKRLEICDYFNKWGANDETMGALLEIAGSNLWSDAARQFCLFQVSWLFNSPDYKRHLLSEKQVNILVDGMTRNNGTNRVAAQAALRNYRLLKDHPQALSQVRHLATGLDCGLALSAADVLLTGCLVDELVLRRINECANNSEAMVRRGTTDVYYNLIKVCPDKVKDRRQQITTILERLAKDRSADVRRDAEFVLNVYKNAK